MHKVLTCVLVDKDFNTSKFPPALVLISCLAFSAVLCLCLLLRAVGGSRKSLSCHSSGVLCTVFSPFSVAFRAIASCWVKPPPPMGHLLPVQSSPLSWELLERGPGLIPGQASTQHRVSRQRGPKEHLHNKGETMSTALV